MTNGETHFQTDKIRKSGDTVNDVSNSWVSASASVYDAWLAYGALGKIDHEQARVTYEELRESALSKLYKANDTIIRVRDSLYKVADEYDGTESKTKHEVKQVPSPHDPDNRLRY